MSEGWPVEPLGAHCSVKARIGWRGLSSSEYTTDGPFLIAGKHVRDGSVDWASCDHITDFRYRESMEIALQAGDVILTKDGTIGRVARVDRLPGRATLNGTMMLLRVGEKLDYRYLFHVLRGHQFKRLIDDKVSGSSIPHIFQRDMVTLPVALLPLEQQRPIADVLDTLDTTIRQTEAIIEKLKQVKQGLLHDLLTRGIDANGELRPPQSQAPHLYKESPLGWIPKEWSVRPLRDVGNFMNGLNKPKQAFGSGTKFVNISDVYADYMDTSVLGRVQTTAGDLNRYRLEPGDIVLDRSSVKLSGVGYPSVFDGDAEPVAFCGFIIRLRLHDHAVCVPRFLCLQMRAARFRNDVFKVATGGANINVNQASLGELLVGVPAPSEQVAIVRRERSVDDRLEAERALCEKLRKQKSGLMDDLLTGCVRVTPLLA